MTDEIFGNITALEAFSSMFRSGRIPHSILIYGEKGLGKKLLAKRLAMALLCENRRDGIPCGECRSCRNIMKNVHPDVIFPEKSGKLMTYTAEICREVCSDCIVLPNDGSAKVYIFSDCDSIKIPAQNSLLKIVEEPPGHVYFIFTASSKDVFLPTIISRVTGIPVCPCSIDECISALVKKGHSVEEAEAAADVFGGNIGKCIGYIGDEALREVTGLTKSAADSIIRGDEYGLLKILSSPVLKDREAMNGFLGMLSCIIRDSTVIKFGADAELSGCSRTLAQKLSDKFSVGSAEKIYRSIERAASDMKANVNPSLITAVLCGEIISS